MESQRIDNPLITIIIPIFNEAKTIVTLVKYLRKASTNNPNFEIIVVDGGSTDTSVTLLSEIPNIQVIHSQKGRAIQMNTGARFATGEILYFLHADSFPPQDFDTAITQAVKNGKKAGCFRMKFDSNHWWLLLMSFFTQCNSKRCRGGDQSLFVTKKTFQKLGGYNEDYKIYEDNDFTNRLYDSVGFTVIKKWLTTSARRYEEHGVFRLQYHFLKIHIMKKKGRHPDSLYAYYQKHIKNTGRSQKPTLEKHP